MPEKVLCQGAYLRASICERCYQATECGDEDDCLMKGHRNGEEFKGTLVSEFDSSWLGML